MARLPGDLRPLHRLPLVHGAGGDRTGRGAVAIRILIIWTTFFDIEHGQSDREAGLSFCIRHIVNEEFAFDAVFDKKTLVVDTTLVAKRFKIYEKFSSGETRKNFYNYTIYVQKFERGWAYGALIVENAYRDIELKQHGPMKQIEQELMYQSSIFYIGDVKCEIIKHLEPNYIVIYTLHRLPRYSIVQANELYKDTYDHVIFTTDPNPSHEEYLRIMNKQNLVTDLENNKVSTYDEYKSIEK